MSLSNKPLFKVNRTPWQASAVYYKFLFVVGGAGGKGTWGKVGQIYEEYENVDANDPNYDSGNEVIPLCNLRKDLRTFLYLQCKQSFDLISMITKRGCAVYFKKSTPRVVRICFGFAQLKN